MPAPFYNAIKGTTGGTPGTGAFTPNVASSGYDAWSVVPAGWIGLTRYEDGAAWELAYSYWNGTTLSRASTQVLRSSTGGIGSQLTLTSAATAAMVIDGSEIAPGLGTGLTRGYVGIPGATTTPSAIGCAAVTVTGTAASATLATTNYLTEQPRSQTDSATTANAQSGYSSGNAFVYSSTSSRGGFEFTCTFGAPTIPTGPRLFVGATSATFVGQTIEPSAYTTHIAVFALDSTDTNIQLLVNNNSGTGTKTTTGIPLAANAWYEATVWAEPGGGTIYGLLVRLDTGAIWLGSTQTDIPTTVVMRGNCVGGLNGTNTGTAFSMCMGAMGIRAGR